jgi:hypothetical protein
VGLLVRATLLRPGRAAVRDASAFPGWEAHGSLEALRVVALPGVLPPLALVRWPQRPGEEARVLDVELGEPGGWRAAAGLLAAVAARTREAGAERLVVAATDPAVTRAARVLGLHAVH